MAPGNHLHATWEAWERDRAQSRRDTEKEPAGESSAEVAVEAEEIGSPAPSDEPEPTREPESGPDSAEPAAPEPEEEAEKRRAPRVNRVQFAKLHGPLGSYRALVINVSCTGVLVTIVDPEFEVSQQASELGLVGLRIASHFGESLDIEFLAANLVVSAEVVRITDGMQEGRWTVYMGCRFTQPLPADQCVLLEIPYEGLGFEEQAELLDGLHDDSEPVAGTEGGAGAAAGGPRVVVVPAGGVAGLGRAAAAKRRLPDKVRITDHGPRLKITDLLKMTIERDATDLHFKGGSPVRLRIDGEILPVGERKLSSDESEGLIRSLLDADQVARFLEEGDLDVAYALEGLARFRINVMRARGEMGMAIRRIPDEVPTVAELGLAPSCTALAEKPRGLVLVTGPTGSGKSTTLAAMIHHVNCTRACHILTMEDPIEYVHREHRACVTQREIGRDSRDFASALRRALRQDPDVILVGEMRDLETIQLAVTAAETGHLVFATLHTTSAVLTVDRIVDVFPSEQQRQIRMQLADSLQGIVSQCLLPRKGRGVVVAQEVLMATSGVRALVREAKAPQIHNLMQTGAKDGMQTMEDSLNDLIARGLITYETALHKANHARQIAREGKILVR